MLNVAQYNDFSFIIQSKEAVNFPKFITTNRSKASIIKLLLSKANGTLFLFFEVETEFLNSVLPRV